MRYFGSISFAVCLLAILMCGMAGAQEVKYVKKETREATRQASLAASGAVAWPAKWYLIGPFDNSDGKGLLKEYPPEKEIKLDAKYPGKKGEQAQWRPFDFADGQMHDLKKFKQADNCVCYLYRVIETPLAQTVRVSLGSDDGIALWLNGKKVLENNAVRGAAPDQESVTLNLHEGKNDLLLKVSNGGNEWQFYFQPTLSPNLITKLDRLIDKDFPPQGEARYYNLQPLPLPEDEAIEVGGLAFRPDGKLYVATRRGDVFLVSNPTSDDPDKIEWKPYLRGLHEILGLTVVGKHDLYLVQRPEITLVRDTDGDDQADEFTTICDSFGISGDYHEYIYGPARDAEGNLFVTLNVGFGGGHQSKVPYRGFCLKITPQGEMIPWAYGLRSPNGINFAPDGRLFYADNQGEWVATCKLQEIRQNEFYGHMASVRWWPGKKDGDQPQMTQPSIWFPYAMCGSASEPAWDKSEGKFGPFAGQCFVGDQKNSLISRVAMEEVKGRMQGACFYFRKDFQCGINRMAFAPDGSLLVGETNRGWGSVGGRPFGLERLSFTGVKPLEVETMHVTPTGWDLAFTMPINATAAAQKETYFLESYTYHHWGTYGSPEIERAENAISAIEVSADGRKVSLSVPKRDVNRVYHLQIKNLKAASGEDLLHPDAYYTLNNLP